MDLWQSAGSNQTGSNQIKPRASGYSLGMAKSGCFAGLCELTYIYILHIHILHITYLYCFAVATSCKLNIHQRNGPPNIQLPAHNSW
jgi:hypothetical protein